MVFAPGIDYNDYDGSVILNCLHGGGCPEGVTYVNDDTGEIEVRDVVPKKAQPVNDPNVGQTLLPDSYDGSSVIDSSLKNVALIDYLIYTMIFIVLFAVIVILLKRRSKKPKIV